MTNIVTRNQNILKDFAKGGVSKAALARKYGVDEKTIRRVLKAGAPAAPVAKAVKTVGANVKDVKASVKQKAQQAVGGATKSAKATTTNSAPKASVTAPTFKVGDKVQTEIGGVVGEIKAVNFRFEGRERVRTPVYAVLWPRHNSTVDIYADDLIPAGTKAPAPVAAQTGVKAALEAGQEVAYIVTGDSIIMTLGDDTEIVDSTHPNYKAIKVAIVTGEYKQAYDLMNISKAITHFTKGVIRVEGGELFYGSMRLKSVLVDRILELMADGDEGFKRLVAFMERLMNNPSRSSVEQLWGFVSHLDVEIDDEGYIIGWKKVQSRNGKLFDSRTGKVPNDVGNVVEMPRHMVDDNRNVTCSQGLHVGAWDYVRSFSGNTILKVRVDPADVVAVPTDYNDMKMRAAKYTVIDTVDHSHKHVDFARAEGVKHLHVVVGTAGELISTKEI